MSQIDARILELIHGELDAENTPEQGEQLRGYLDTSAEARAQYEALSQLHATLARVGSVEPPPQLRAAILQALPPAKRRWALMPSDTWAALRWAALRYSVVFAAGVFGAAILLRHDASVDTAQVIGTMASPAPGVGVVDMLEFDFAALSGRVQLGRQQMELMAEVDVNVHEAVRIEMRTSGGEYIARLAPGEHRYVVYPGEAPAADVVVDVEIFAAGALIHSGSLKAPATRQDR